MKTTASSRVIPRATPRRISAIVSNMMWRTTFSVDTNKSNKHIRFTTTNRVQYTDGNESPTATHSTTSKRRSADIDEDEASCPPPPIMLKIARPHKTPAIVANVRSPVRIAPIGAPLPMEEDADAILEESSESAVDLLCHFTDCAQLPAPLGLANPLIFDEPSRFVRCAELPAPLSYTSFAFDEPMRLQQCTEPVPLIPSESLTCNVDSYFARYKRIFTNFRPGLCKY